MPLRMSVQQIIEVNIVIIKPASLKDAYMIQSDRKEDHRGFFSRLYCKREFEKLGIGFTIAQSNLSYTQKRNTIRGMHYQIEGAEEEKLVTCLSGSVLDVIIDLRRDSGTFGRHIMVELSEIKGLSLLVPKGCAHGFLSLEDNCLLMYFVSNFYEPGKERGVRWNDPYFGINWPVMDPIISEKDAALHDFNV